jgi:nucleoside-diphosphate-sugar epimerase
MMKIFIAGATGAVGRRLIPVLIQRGHQVIGMSRSKDKMKTIRANGATPVIADAFDAEALNKALRDTKPDVVIHQLTAIPGRLNLRNIGRDFALTNRLRTEGTDHLLAAAKAAGAHRFIAQSFAGWPYARRGGPVKTEDDPLDPDPPRELRAMLAAIEYSEKAVLESPNLDGVLLRYGAFYGPGTSISADGSMLEDVRHRRIPIVGRGAGVWSFVHVDDVATATLAAAERGRPGIYNVVDDDPAPVSEWLPALAKAVGAPPPLRIPAFIGRLAVGAHGISLMNEIRGASNAKARQELSWTPFYRTWRSGFREGLR